MSTGWSDDEIRATVEDYFEILGAELTGEQFNKTQHRRRLISLLRGRSPTAVERKHQNISAVLLEEGFPFVDGYKPLGNYQRALRDEVIRFVDEHSDLRRLIERIEAELPLAHRMPSRIAANLFVEPPEHDALVVSGSGPKMKRPAASYDFELRDERIRKLGIAGEEFVVRLEQTRLEQGGRPDLASKVEWVSETRGGGAGFDVLSFDFVGEERFVEVKTTNFGRRYPFLISRNEVNFSDENERQFLLYRVFQFSRSPRLYSLPGSVRKSCSLDPVLYQGRP